MQNKPAFQKFIKTLKKHLEKKAAGQRTVYPYHIASDARREARGGTATKESLDAFGAMVEAELKR